MMRGARIWGWCGRGKGDGGGPQRAELARAEKQERPGVRVLGALGRREEKENGMSMGWGSSWTGKPKPRESARSVPLRR
jgi:hypothetical protein